MTSESAPRPDPLRIDGILPLLPETEVLRSLADHLLASARPDPLRRWTGSGELGTWGSRIVDPEALEAELPAILAGESERLERMYRRVLAIAREVGSGRPLRAARLLMEEGEALEGEGRPAEAERWYLAGRALARREGSPFAVRGLRLAARCARARGSLAEAADRYEGAWREAGAADLVEDAVVAATGRGNVSIDRGRWDEAEAWYVRALEATEAPALAGDQGAHLRWPLAQNLSIVAREARRFEEAERWLKQGEAWAEGAARRVALTGETPDRSHQLDFANGWGQLALARGEPELAAARFREALEGTGSALSRIGVKVNLGEALLQLGRTLEAGGVAREAEAEALAGRVLGRLPEIYRLLARVAAARGEPDAFVFLERGLALIREHRLPPYEEVLTLEALAVTREEEGEAEVAADARARAVKLAREVGLASEHTMSPSPEYGEGTTPPDDESERSEEG
jgi:tetratricopeptide (TPR) repeat protein